MGETFSPDLSTGTGNVSVPIALQTKRNGFQPSLALNYSTGAGNGPFGTGCALSVSGVSPLTSNGIPSYRDQSPPDECDIFALSGAEDVVKLDGDSGAPTTYRARTKGLFAGITHRIETDGVATDH